jgi:hypothetical protein
MTDPLLDFRTSDGLDVTVRPPQVRQPWCLEVVLSRAASGERITMLWDAVAPLDLVLATAPPPNRLIGAPHGRDVVITAEQGIGDVIQHWRYIKTLTEQLGPLTIACRPEMQRLIAQQPVPTVTVSPHDVPAAVTTVSLMRLHRLYSDPTDGAPYLTCPAATPPVDSRKRPRVGLNWTTNARAAGREHRSVPLALLELIVRRRPDIAWVSIQWGPDEDRLAEQPWAAAIERAGHALRDVADLASVIGGLDLLISIDSAPSHIAGALGVPAWTLLSHPCSWRYGLQSLTTALYRTMTLVRQQTQGDWPGVMDEVLHMLDARYPTNGERTIGMPVSRPVTPPISLRTPARSDSPTGAPLTVAEALRLCRIDTALRNSFVLHPLRTLAALNVAISGEDHCQLAQVLQAIVECHGGFSWCSPLADATSSERP